MWGPVKWKTLWECGGGEGWWDGKWTHKPTALLRVMAFGALMLYDNINHFYQNLFTLVKFDWKNSKISWGV